MSARCTAHSSRTKRPCRAYAVRGASVCRSHGGGAPQVQRAARRRLAGQEAAKMLADVQVQPVDDPIAELEGLAGEALALRSFFAARVAALERAAKDDPGPIEALAQLRGLNSAALMVLHDARASSDPALVLQASDRIANQLRLQAGLLASMNGSPPAQGELDLYLGALDRAERFLRDLAALGLDERRTRLVEAQGLAVADVLRASTAAILTLVREALEAGTIEERLTHIEREEAPAVMRRELLAVLPAKGGTDG